MRANKTVGTFNGASTEIKAGLCMALTVTFLAGSVSPASAGPIYATGQLLRADGVRENRIYRIDPTTGVATALSDLLPTAPAALAALPASSAGPARLIAYTSGTLWTIDPLTGVLSDGVSFGVSGTGLDALADGRVFLITANAAAQVFRLNAATNLPESVIEPGAIAAALGAVFGGSPSPFILSLGSVGGTLYGLNSESNRTNLVAINPDTGSITPVGPLNAVGQAAGGFTGYSALTGVDTDGDGAFDALFGNANFNSPALPRAGAVVRYDLTAGTFTVVGTNPGIIFFGFASFPGAGLTFPCNPADITGIGGPPAGPDGLLTGDDFNAFVSAFAAGEVLADVVGIGGLPPGDGLITGDDFNAFIGAFAAGCP